LAAQPESKHPYRHYLIQIVIVVATAIALTRLVSYLIQSGYVPDILRIYINITILLIGGYIIIHVITGDNVVW
jgi:hypothetical protein